MAAHIRSYIRYYSFSHKQFSFDTKHCYVSRLTANNLFWPDLSVLSKGLTTPNYPFRGLGCCGMWHNDWILGLG